MYEEKMTQGDLLCRGQESILSDLNSQSKGLLALDFKFDYKSMLGAVLNDYTHFKLTNIQNMFKINFYKA